MSSLQDSISRLVPALRSRADAVEKARQIPAETIAELREAGLFRALVPRKFGGDERGLGEVLEAAIELSRGCSSTGWVGSLVTIHALAIAWFDQRAQEEVWSNGPDTLVVTSLAPSGQLEEVEGGFRLSGRWPFVSGVDHGAWAMVGAQLKGRLQYLLLPRSDFSIVDDWYVAGLRGTGSKSLVIESAFIPKHRTIAMAQLKGGGHATHAAPVYRLPWTQVFAATFPPMALGTALASLDAFREYVATRVHAYEGTAYRTSPGHLLRVADAAAHLDAALALYRRTVARIEEAGSELGALEGQDVIYNCAFVIDRASYVIGRLFRGSGGKALRDDNPIQRHFRDVHAMTQHVGADLDVHGLRYGSKLIEETHGRVAKGDAR